MSEDPYRKKAPETVVTSRPPQEFSTGEYEKQGALDHTGEYVIPDIAVEMADLDTRTKNPCLMVIGGLDMGAVVAIGEQGVTLGRSPDCTVPLSDDSISRYHAKIEMADSEHAIVTDLGSTNGTFVNGKPVKKIKIKPDSKILLGRNTILKFVFNDDMDLRYQHELYDSSTKDGLTGIFNRRYLFEKLQRDLSFARRHRIPFTFIMFDIDHFKNINDTFGHPVGDQVLISVTRIISSSIRTEDTLGRYGGEEFGLIAQGTGPTGAIVLGDRIREKVEAEPMLAVTRKNRPVRATISVGVATVTSEMPCDAQTLLSTADENLYKAKAAGRNKTVASVVGFEEPRPSKPKVLKQTLS